MGGRGGVLVISYLDQVEEVGKVGSYEVRYRLICVCLAFQRLQLPIPSYPHHELINVGCDDQPLDPLEGGFQPG